MKKLITILLIAVTFSSCTYNTDNAVNKDTKIPNSVYAALQDTTLKPKYIIVEADGYDYVINRTTADKNLQIEKYYEKEISTWLFVMLGILIALLMISLLGIAGAFD